MSEALRVAEQQELDSEKSIQILDGARRCFMAQGFDGASMNDIVKAAGVSKGTVYAYFPSKEKLFESLVFHDKRKQAEAMTTITAEDRPIADVLRDIGLSFTNTFRSPESIAYARMAIGASAKFPEIGRAIYEGGIQHSIDRVAAYFDRKMADGTLKRRDAKLLAVQFIDLVQSGITKPRLFGVESMADRLGVETVVNSAVELFLAGACENATCAPGQTA